MSDLADYFLNTSAAVAPLDLIEITHPDFSTDYRVVRNAVEGVTVDLSATEKAVAFNFYPAKITAPGARDDTDAIVKVDLGDVGETIATEMENLQRYYSFLTKPQMRYWLYRSDVLSAPIVGPINLEISDIEFAKEGATFEAMAPQLNTKRTGRSYTLDVFPMLRAFAS